jgi:hypothetical protein
MDDPGEQQPLLASWRQGDFSLDATLKIPLLGQDDEGPFVGSADGRGMIVISQSCDIIRDHSERPFVQVSPLLEASESELVAIAEKQRPRYATFGALAENSLVVDLDVVATVDKRIVADWERAGGCSSEAERAEFAASLARHKQRFAFPDGFDATIKDFRRWIERRAKKPNAAGEMIRAIEEIRVRCDDWEADPLALELICILKGDPPAEQRQSWNAPRGELESKLTAACPDAFVRIASKVEVGLIEYQESHFLDLDGLSDA